MKKYDIEKIKSFDSYDELASSVLSKQQIEENEKSVTEIAVFLKSLQDEVSRALISYMEKEHIGFNELTRRFALSSRQSSKILKGEANITLATLSELGHLLGKRPRIVWEDAA